MKDNRIYVGMDVHKAMTVIIVLNALGKQIMHSVVETKAATIVAAIKALRGDVHVTFEESIHAEWLYGLLKPYVSEIVVCQAQYLPAQPNNNKSDDIDALRMAEALRMGVIKSVYHGEASLHTLRELAKSYQCLVADCTSVKNRIKAIYRARALKCDGDSIYQVKYREDYLTQLSEAGARIRAARLMNQLDDLNKLCEEAEAEMIAEARKQPAFQIIDSVPMIGPVRAALILAAVQTPHRFRSKRQFWTYCGFSVVNETSADYQLVAGKIKKVVQAASTRGLNRNYQHTLKSVFKAAANGVRSGPLKKLYDEMRSKGIKEQMARLTLARKIAAITLAVWKKGERFNPELLTKQSV